jgi:hypothetical protein
LRENTRQHYIPQAYLCNFVEKGKGIWVYNKTNSKKYLTSIDKICYTDDFYSLSEKTIKESSGVLNRLSIEKNFFAKNVEVQWATLLKQLVNTVELNIQQNPRPILVLDEDSKRLLAQHVAIQFIRLPEYRQQLEESQDCIIRSIKKIMDCDNARKASNFSEIEGFLNKDGDSAFEHYLYGFGSEEIVDGFVSRLVSNYWELYISTNDYFYTSDFPIIVEPHVKDAELECLGLTMYGAEATFPLTKKVLLKIWDKRYFPNKKDTDGEFIYASNSFVRCENIRQYLYARNIVISSCNDFSLPEFIKNKEGHEVSMHPNFKTVSNWD